MKKIFLLMLGVLCLYGCGHNPYKYKHSINYSKKRLPIYNKKYLDLRHKQKVKKNIDSNKEMWQHKPLDKQEGKIKDLESQVEELKDSLHKYKIEQLQQKVKELEKAPSKKNATIAKQPEAKVEKLKQEEKIEIPEFKNIPLNRKNNIEIDELIK